MRFRALAGAIGFLLLACAGGEAPPPPDLASVELSEEERAALTDLTFDELVARALEAPEGDDVEAFRRNHDGKTVGWSGVVRANRLIRKGARRNEYALTVSAPSSATSTVQVVFVAAEDSQVARLGGGAGIAFVGRLEFDGRTREPWVLDARLAPPGPAP